MFGRLVTVWQPDHRSFESNGRWAVLVIKPKFIKFRNSFLSHTRQAPSLRANFYHCGAFQLDFHSRHAVKRIVMKSGLLYTTWNFFKIVSQASSWIAEKRRRQPWNTPHSCTTYSLQRSFRKREVLWKSDHGDLKRNLQWAGLEKPDFVRFWNSFVPHTKSPSSLQTIFFHSNGLLNKILDVGYRK